MRFYQLDFKKKGGSWQTFDSLNSQNPNALRITAEYPLTTDNTISPTLLTIYNAEFKYMLNSVSFVGQAVRLAFGIFNSPFGQTISKDKPNGFSFSGQVIQQLPQAAGFDNQILLKILSNEIVITNPYLNISKGFTLYEGFKAWFTSNGVLDFSMSSSTLSMVAKSNIQITINNMTSFKDFVYFNYGLLTRVTGNMVYIAKFAESYLDQKITVFRTSDIIGNPVAKPTTTPNGDLAIAQLILSSHMRCDVQVLDYVEVLTDLPLDLGNIANQYTFDAQNSSIAPLLNASGLYQVVNIVNNLDTISLNAQDCITSFTLNKVGN